MYFTGLFPAWDLPPSCYCLHFYQSWKRSHQFQLIEDICSSAVFLTSGNSNSILLSCLGQKCGCPFHHITHATDQKTTSALPPKSIQNLTTFHHLHCPHSASGRQRPDRITAGATTYSVSLLGCYDSLQPILHTATEEILLKRRSDLIITFLLKPLQ